MCERRSLTSDPARAGQISSPPRRQEIERSRLISTALCPPPSPSVFLLCYLEQKSLDNVIPFPEQIQPRCIVPYAYGTIQPQLC